MRLHRVAAAFFFSLWATAVPLAAQTSSTPQAAQSSQSAATNSGTSSAATQLDVSVTQQWVDTNLYLRSGEKLKISATGTANYPAGTNFGPDGSRAAGKTCCINTRFPTPDTVH